MLIDLHAASGTTAFDYDSAGNISSVTPGVLTAVKNFLSAATEVPGDILTDNGTQLIISGEPLDML